MPLIRRLPKRGFNNAAFHKRCAIVNLDDLNAFKAGTAVNEELLRESKLVRGDFVGIKILGDGELKHGLKVEADKVSASAREKIEKAGGMITLREKAERPHAAAASEASPGKPAGEAASERTQKKKSSKKTSAKAKRKHRGRASFPAHDVSHLADGFGVSQHGQDTRIAPAHYVYAGRDRDCASRSGNHNARSQSGCVAGVVSHLA